MKDEKVDQILKDALEFNECPPDELNLAIMDELEEKEMRKHFGKKILVASLAATLLLGGAVYASATGGMSTMTSNPATEQTEFSEMDEIIEDAGFTFKYVEQIEDFDFTSAEVTDCQDTDAEGNVTNTYKAPSLDYTNEDGDTMNVTVQEKAETSDEVAYLDSYEGISYIYLNVPILLVPEGYEMTDEDLEAQENGVSYSEVAGLDAPVEIQTTSIGWYDDGLFYNLSTPKDGYTEDDMIDFMMDVYNA